MWQKNKGKFHLLLRFSADLIDGKFLQSACGDQIQVRRKAQRSWIWGEEKMCPICMGIWRLCFTSVDDARQSLKNQTNIKVLERALEIARQATLKKAIETRIKKLKGNS
jgi:hypothetical protein